MKDDVVELKGPQAQRIAWARSGDRRIEPALLRPR